MRVLITGASGFVGKSLCRLLVTAGDEVAGGYIRERPELEGVDLHEADMLDLPALERAVERSEPEAVVHLAALSQVAASWERMGEYFRVNVLGTENLLRVASGIRTVVASSAEVYGPVPDGEQPIREQRCIDPSSPYALTKAAAERIALAAGACVVRSFNAVGPGQSRHFALPSFAAQLAAIRRGEREPVLEVGNLEARRDFVHVEDAAKAYRLVLREGEAGGVYNLGSGVSVPISGALEMLIEISGLEVEVRPDPARYRPVDLPRLEADNRRLRGLGWGPRRTLRQALEDVWREALGEG